MQLQRTTLRIKPHLKKSAEKLAWQQDTTFQEIVNRALENYLETKAKKQAKKIVFKTHDLGVALDRLVRADYY